MHSACGVGASTSSPEEASKFKLTHRADEHPCPHLLHQTTHAEASRGFPTHSYEYLEEKQAQEYLLPSRPPPLPTTPHNLGGTIQGIACAQLQVREAPRPINTHTPMCCTRQPRKKHPGGHPHIITSKSSLQGLQGSGEGMGRAGTA